MAKRTKPLPIDEVIKLAVRMNTAPQEVKTIANLSKRVEEAKLPQSILPQELLVSAAQAVGATMEQWDQVIKFQANFIINSLEESEEKRKLLEKPDGSALNQLLVFMEAKALSGVVSKDEIDHARYQVEESGGALSGLSSGQKLVEEMKKELATKHPDLSDELRNLGGRRY